MGSLAAAFGSKAAEDKDKEGAKDAASKPDAADDASVLTEKSSFAGEDKGGGRKKKKGGAFLPRVRYKHTKVPMEKTVPAKEEAKAPAKVVECVFVL